MVLIISNVIYLFLSIYLRVNKARVYPHNSSNLTFDSQETEESND